MAPPELSVHQCPARNKKSHLKNFELFKYFVDQPFVKVILFCFTTVSFSCGLQRKGIKNSSGYLATIWDITRKYHRLDDLQRYVFLTLLKAEKAKIKVLADFDQAVVWCEFVCWFIDNCVFAISSQGRRGRGGPEVFYKGPNPFIRAKPSWSNHFPKVLV